MAPEKTDERIHYIDNLRVIACFLVLLFHSNQQGGLGTHSETWLTVLALLGSPASELFLALSGTVLLPIKTGMKKFYQKRFWRLVPPFLFWSVAGIVIYVLSGRISSEEGIMRLYNIPLKPSIGVYWFIYVMIGLYLFAPVISAFLRTAGKRQIEFFLVLWGITLLMPWVYGIWGETFDQHGDHYWMLNYFGGFIGYWILGFYLHKYPVSLSLNRKFIALTVLTLVYPLMILIMKYKGMDTSDYTDNLQLGSAFMVAALFTIVRNIRLSPGVQRVMTAIARYSFGIYLIHIYIVIFFIKGFSYLSLHTLPRTLLIAVISMGLSWCVIWLISKLP